MFRSNPTVTIKNKISERKQTLRQKTFCRTHSIWLYNSSHFKVIFSEFSWYRKPLVVSYSYACVSTYSFLNFILLGQQDQYFSNHISSSLQSCVIRRRATISFQWQPVASYSSWGFAWVGQCMRHFKATLLPCTAMFCSNSATVNDFKSITDYARHFLTYFQRDIDVWYKTFLNAKSITYFWSSTLEYVWAFSSNWVTVWTILNELGQGGSRDRKPGLGVENNEKEKWRQFVDILSSAS